MARERLDIVVDGAPDDVRARLDAGLLVIRSVWFPTLAELRAWDRATARLYLRWRGPDRFEIGPRLGNPQAARLAPVVRGVMRAEGQGRTRIEGTWGWPGLTLVLAAVWALLFAGWFAVVWTQQSAVGLGAWAVSAAVMSAGALGARHYGGGALASALPELSGMAADPHAGADDWA